MLLRDRVWLSLVCLCAWFASNQVVAQESGLPSSSSVVQVQRHRGHPFPPTPGQAHAGVPSRTSASTRQPAAHSASTGTLINPAPPFAGFYSGPYFSAAGTEFTAGYLPVAGDFNHDGKQDMVTFASDVICMRPGNGDGTFGAPILTIPNPGQFYYGYLEQIAFAQAADLNGDGYTDLIAGDNHGLVVLLNLKDGTFALSSLLQPPLLSTGLEEFIRAIAVGPTTASGLTDVVEVWIDAQGNTNAETFLNDGTGAFSSSKISSYAISSANMLVGPTIALADIDHDGHPDLLVEKHVASNILVEISAGRGDGSFVAPVNSSILYFPTGSTADLWVTSLTGDAARQDILVSTDYGPYLALSNGDGTYQLPRPALPSDPIATPMGEAGSPLFFMGIQTADLNGDGKQDLVLTVGSGLAAYLGNGDGTFGPVAGTASLSSNFVGLYSNSGDNVVTVTQMVLADWNGDGKTDFGFANLFSGYIGVGLGDGKGGFATAPLLYSPGTPRVSPLAFSAGATADLNRDGIADVLGYDAVDGSLISALAAGKGTFTYKQALPGSAFDTLSVSSTTGDFNSDGSADFVILAKDGSLAVALSNGDGTLQTPSPIPGVNIHACELNIATADVNGDGKLDLVISYAGDANCLPGALAGSGNAPSGYFVILGNGDGSFSSENVHFYALGSALGSVALAHYHGVDHPLDLVVADGLRSVLYATPSVSLLTGQGDGTFSSSVTVDSDHAAAKLLVDDYDLDGRPDLTLIADANFTPQTTIEGGILLLPGNGDGTFGSTVMVPGNTDAEWGGYADVNGDGIPDLILDDSPYYTAGQPGKAYSGVTVLLGTGMASFAPPINYPSSAAPLLIGNFLGDNTVSVVARAGSATGFLINQGGSSLQLTSSASNIAAGESLTLTATMQATLAGRPIPSGSVVFYDGQSALGSGAVNNGTLAFSATSFAPGTHTLKAVYSGDANFNPNTSSSIALTVTAAPPAPDYSLTLSAADLTIIKGQTGTLKVVVTANPNLDSSVTFACSGLPAESTCSFSPPVLNVAGGQTGVATLTIGTKAALATADLRRENRPPRLLASAVLTCVLCCVVPFGAKWRRMWMLVLIVFALSGAVALIGCGSGGGSRSSSAPPDPGTPAGTSVVTVTATAMSGTTPVTHTASVTLAVQ